MPEQIYFYIVSYRVQFEGLMTQYILKFACHPQIVLGLRISNPRTQHLTQVRVAIFSKKQHLNYSIVAMRKCNPRTLSSPRTAYFKNGVQFENLFNLEKAVQLGYSHQRAPGTGPVKVSWRVIPATAGSQLHHT